MSDTLKKHGGWPDSELADDDGRYELHMCHCESCGRVRKAIQLDAYKQGMTDAAAKVWKCCADGLISLGAVKEEILAARDNKTSI